MMTCEMLKKKFVEVRKSGTGFRLNGKPRSSVQKCKLKIIFNCDLIGVVISRTKFDICAPCSFGGV